MTPMDFMMDATTMNTSYHIWTISTWDYRAVKTVDGNLLNHKSYYLATTRWFSEKKPLGIFRKKNYFKDVLQSPKWAASLEWKYTIMITTFFNIRKQTLTADLKMKEHFSEILILIYNMHRICEKSSFKQIKLN